MSESTTGIPESETNCQIPEMEKQIEGTHKKPISKESAVRSQESITPEANVTGFMDTNIECANTVQRTTLQQVASTSQELKCSTEDDLINFSEVELGARMCCLYIDSLSESIETEPNYVSSEICFPKTETNILSPSSVEHTEEEIINTFTDENNSHILNVTYIIDKNDDQNYSDSRFLYDNTSFNEREDSEEDILDLLKNRNNSHVFDRDENSLPRFKLGDLSEKSPHYINDTTNEKPGSFEGEAVISFNYENISQISGIDTISDYNYGSLSEISFPYDTNSIQSMKKDSSPQAGGTISPIYDIINSDENSLSILEVGFIRSVHTQISEHNNIRQESGDFEAETSNSLEKKLNCQASDNSGFENNLSAAAINSVHAESSNHSKNNSLINGSTVEQSEDPKTPCHDLISCICSIPKSRVHRTEFEILSEQNCSKTLGQNNLIEAGDMQPASNSFQGAPSNSTPGNLGTIKKCNRSIQVRHRRNLVSRIRRGIGKTVHKIFGKGTNRIVQQEINEVKKITKRPSISNFINIVRDPRLPRTFNSQLKKKLTQDHDTSSQE